MKQLANMLDGLENDLGRLGGGWRPLGDVLAVLEEILGVLEAFGRVLEALEGALKASCCPFKAGMAKASVLFEHVSGCLESR